MIKVEDIVDWFLLNRRGKAFRGYTRAILISQLCECIDEGMIRVITESDNNIVGVVCCKQLIKEKLIYVYDILTTKKGVVKQMVQFVLKEFPGYSIGGKIGERERRFHNAEKLHRRL